MSKPAFIFIATGLRIALLAAACCFTALDKLRSLKRLIPDGLPRSSKKADVGQADANQAGVMRMSDGPH